MTILNKKATIQTMKKYDVNISNLATLLTINIQGDGSELLEYLPQPHKYHRYNLEAYQLQYLLSGVFWTAKSSKYLNDMLLRLNISMDIKSIEYKSVSATKNDYELNLFQNLKSLNKKVFIPRANKHDDSVFWGLKLFMEHYVGKDGFVPYSTLFEYAHTHYHDHIKDFSTLKAKCRSVWNYYEAKNWETDKYIRKYTDEELKMSRTEHIKKVHKNRSDDTYKKIVNTITGMFGNEYKKASTSTGWNISKLAKELRLSRTTVTKYIKEYEEKKA